MATGAHTSNLTPAHVNTSDSPHSHNTNYFSSSLLLFKETSNMQTYAVALSLLFAATGINAAPGVSPRQSTSIPIQIFDSAGCNNGPPTTTINLPTDGSCFGFSPVVSSNTDSGLIDSSVTLGAGCRSKSTLPWKYLYIDIFSHCFPGQ